jgi:hypothetical protein
MIISLAVNGLGYLFMSQAHTYLGFAVLMVFMGASNPLYQVGSDAMLADMIVPEKRTNAYAIIRMINNAGIAIGPAMGGFVASRSYSYAFLGAAIGMITYSLLLIFRARETLNKAYLSPKAHHTETLGGYGRVFRDRPYVVFALLIGLGLVAPSMLWTLLSVYNKITGSLKTCMAGYRRQMR